METIIEEDSGGPAALLITIIFLLLIAGGAWFAYANGAFGGKTTVIENSKTIIMAAQPSASAPAGASAKPKQ